MSALTLDGHHTPYFVTRERSEAIPDDTTTTLIASLGTE
jgi:hypothetical protein